MTPRTIREIVRNLPESDLHQIIQDHNTLERDGAIGDCTLRKVAQEWISGTGFPGFNVILIMEKVTTEAYRYFYEKFYLDQ